MRESVFDVLERKPLIYTYARAHTAFGQMDFVASVSHGSSMNCARRREPSVHWQYLEPPTHNGARKDTARPSAAAAALAGAARDRDQPTYVARRVGALEPFSRLTHWSCLSVSFLVDSGQVDEDPPAGTPPG